MLHDPWRGDRAMKPGRRSGITTSRALADSSDVGNTAKGAVRGVSRDRKVDVPMGTRRDSHADNQRERALARKTELDRTRPCRNRQNGDALRQKDRDTGKKFQTLQPVSTDSNRVL